MTCRHYIVPPHLLRAIADSEENSDKIRHAARRSLTARDAYTKVRAERMAALTMPRGYQRQQIIPPHILRSLSQSEESEEIVRDRAKRDLQHVEGLMQQKLRKFPLPS